MSIDVRIKGNSGNYAKINGEGEFGMVVHTHPPIDETTTSLPFRQYFTDDGTSTGSNDMKVNGSSTSVDFYIKAIPAYDLFLRSVSIKLADAGAAFNEFGNLPQLTNGVAFRWVSQVEGELDIHDGIKNNLEFFRLSDQPALIIDLSGAGADAVVVYVDLAKMFGNQWGIRLTKGTTEKLIWTIQDNVSAVDEFNIIGYGAKV